MAEAAIESEVAVEIDMEVEGGVSTEETNGVEAQAGTANVGTKREREDEVEGEDGNLKKANVERSVEEERLEKEKNEETQGDEGEEEVDEGEGGGGEEEGEKEETKEVKLGPKVFISSQDMFNYFFKLLHNWGLNLDINQYEHMVLIDLLKKGHNEPERKIGKGIEAFEVRFHPVFRSRCFFVRRIDGSSDDFSYRKCIDAIMPLPNELQINPDSGRSKGERGGGGRGGRGGRRGGRRGRGRGRR